MGCKVTLRGAKAREFLVKALWVKNKQVMAYNFDPAGNLSFGISDYTDFEGMKYDPAVGIFGMDVNVRMVKPGVRVRLRRLARSRIPSRQNVGREEGMSFVRSQFGVEVLE